MIAAVDHRDDAPAVTSHTPTSTSEKPGQQPENSTINDRTIFANKLVKRAERSRIIRKLETRLGLAAFKVQRGWEKVPWAHLEANYDMESDTLRQPVAQPVRSEQVLPQSTTRPRDYYDPYYYSQNPESEVYMPQAVPYPEVDSGHPPTLYSAVKHQVSQNRQSHSSPHHHARNISLSSPHDTRNLPLPQPSMHNAPPQARHYEEMDNRPVTPSGQVMSRVKSSTDNDPARAAELMLFLAASPSPAQTRPSQGLQLPPGEKIKARQLFPDSSVHNQPIRPPMQLIAGHSRVSAGEAVPPPPPLGSGFEYPPMSVHRVPIHSEGYEGYQENQMRMPPPPGYGHQPVGPPLQSVQNVPAWNQYPPVGHPQDGYVHPDSWYIQS